MQALFMDLHSDDHLVALDIAMANLEVEQGQPFMDDWKVYKTMLENDESFQNWTRDQFINSRAEEDWGEQQLAEPRYVMIADDWHPDRDWTNKGNREKSKAGVETRDVRRCGDTRLTMVSEPELIMTVDQQGNSTPMASAIMVVKDVQGRPCS